MNENNIHAYGKLFSLFYDATEKFASDQEVQFFAQHIKQHPGKVLEAMSGSGRLQIPLIQRGYVVDGVDQSSAMLNRCRQRCALLHIEPNLYQQSLETLSLPSQYQTVIIAFGSFQLIIDETAAIKALQNLKKHMTANGHLFIDIFIPDTTIDTSSTGTVSINEHTLLRVKKRHIFDTIKQLSQTFYIYELIASGIVQEQENALIELVWRTDEQWRTLLDKAGFETIKIHDEMFNLLEPSRIIQARPYKT